MSKLTILIALLLLNSVANAEIVFQSRAQLGVQAYEFELNNPRVTDASLITSTAPIDPATMQPRQRTPSEFEGDLTFDANYLTLNSAIRENQPLSDTLPILGLGGTVIFENGLFIDGYYQTNISGDQAAIASTNDPSQTVNFRLDDIASIDIDRSDYAFALGKSFGSFNISAGYKYGESVFEQSFAQLFSPILLPANLRAALELDGPFIGAAYSFPIGSSTLSFNLAVAELDAEYTTVFQSLRPLDDQEFRVSSRLQGEASGITYGIKLSGELIDNWSYTLGADYYSYNFDVAATVFQDRSLDSQMRLRGNHSAPLAAEVTEQVLSFRFDLKFTF